MSRNALIAAVLLIAVYFAGMVAFANHQHKDDLALAQDSVQVALKGAAAARTAALAERATADSAEARATRAEARADSIAHARRPVEVRYAVLRAAAPDTCRPALDAAQAVIASDSAELAERSRSLQELRDALAHTKTASDTVLAADGRLGASASVLLHVSRPSLLARLAPKVGVGATAGVDLITRRPVLAAGLTLGWTF